LPTRRACLARASAGLLTICQLSSCRSVVQFSDAPAPAASAPIAAGPGDDVGEWTDRLALMLGRWVQPLFGTVDYDQVRAALAETRALVDALAEPRDFPSPAARLAWLVNAYNLLVVHAVADFKPVDTPRHIPGLFDRRRWRVFGRLVTLDELRDDHLRPLGDPRIHAALCYAAVGSPPLNAQPLRAQRLDEQLDRLARRWVSHPTQFAAIGDLLLVSPLLQWFAPDFQAAPYRSALGFLKHHADPRSPLARLLSSTAPRKIEYMEFNWALNAQSRTTGVFTWPEHGVYS
jgi:hypothetical protein